MHVWNQQPVDQPVDVGVVPDEVLLLLGHEGSALSRWWTPVLSNLDPAEADERRSAAAAMLAADGALVDGELLGPLRTAADVVRSATSVLTLESVVADVDELVRASLVVTGDAVLLDVQDHQLGGHRLVVLSRARAAAWLAGVLDPDGCAHATSSVRPVAPATLATTLPSDPTSTVRAVRVALDGDDAVQHAVTVFAHDGGLTTAWAAPDGGALVGDVGDALELAVVLVAGVVGGVAA